MIPRRYPTSFGGGWEAVMPSRLPDRSKRQLMRHAADRLSVLWYLGYDLGEPLPDHSSLTRFRWKLWPRQVTGDTKYGTEENIVALENQHIRAYVPLPDSDHRTEFFSSDRFRYEAERDVYMCPAGKELHFFQAHSTERSRRYRARAKDCNHCPLKAKCTTSKQGRSLCRSVDEEYLDRVRAYASTEAYKKAYRKRSVWVEPLFARSANSGMA